MTTVDVLVLCVPFVIPTLKARLQLQETKSGEWRRGGEEGQQHRTHLRTSKTISFVPRSSSRGGSFAKHVRPNSAVLSHRHAAPRQLDAIQASSPGNCSRQYDASCPPGEKLPAGGWCSWLTNWRVAK